MPKICMGGICGMGMAPLAAFLADSGERVCGFDDAPNPEISRMLESRGIELRKKAEDFTEFYSELIISSALSGRARNLPIPCGRLMRRGEKWAEICASRRLVAVIGSHGKSTVSALLAHAAHKLNSDCGWLIGAIPRGMPMHKYCADGKTVFSEIDESDGTIENFSPEITVALNYDLDHTDTYANPEELEDMFARIFARTKKLVIYPSRDGALKKIAERFAPETLSVNVPENFIERNVAMAKSAFEASEQCSLQSGIFSDFKGLMRRQEIIADTPELFALADYAHHPSELKIFLEWFSASRAGRKLVIFQPHRYTRTKKFAKQFAEILSYHAAKGSKVLLLPVYAASENFDAEGTSQAIVKLSSGVELVGLDEAEKKLRDELSKGALSLAVVGAGDYYFEAKKLISKL